MNIEELIQKARSVASERKLSDLCIAGEVGATIVTDKGNVYTGTCLDSSCGMGLCAEVSAIASMVTGGESRIKTIVAVGSDGRILSPCGKCREFMAQVNVENMDTEIILSEKTLKLKDLLPEYWYKNNTL